MSTIPILCMALFAAPAAPLAGRVGARRAVAVALFLIAAGGLLRAAVPTTALVIAATVPIGIGMGLANALMVTVVKERFPDRQLLATGVWASSMGIGSSLAAALAVPAAANLGGWRGALALFSLAAVVSLAAWLWLERGREEPARVRLSMPRLPWRHRLVWLFALLWLLQSGIYYGLGSWLPDAFVERGWNEEDAGYLIAALNIATVPATLLTAWAGERIGGSRRRYLVAGSLLVALGTVLLIEVPSGGLAWAALVGVGSGALFTLTMTLPLDVADRPVDAGAVAGLMLGVGYTFSALAPLVLGAVRDGTGSFTAALWALVAAALVLAAASLACSPARLRRGVRAVPAGG
jgi:CP family cyanate transporter-like MFS transporter